VPIVAAEALGLPGIGVERARRQPPRLRDRRRRHELAALERAEAAATLMDVIVE
jgi:hypothetical protein